MRVYVCRPIPENGIQMLKEAGLDVVVNPENRVLLKSELIKAIQDFDGVLSILTDVIDEEVLGSSPTLKIVANYAVGFNNINVAAATKLGILVTNTPGVLDNTTADFTFALIMAAGRHIIAADRFSRAGKFDKWEPMGFLGQDVFAATLGIVGAGRIGARVAKIGIRGFDMKVLYSDHQKNAELDEMGAEQVELEDLLQKSDFVSLHVPLLDSTKHMMGPAQFKMMRKTAYLINTARGPIVNEQALVDALKSGEIAGAGLDVYENEPNIHPDLLTMENVILAPHIASASLGTRGAMARIAAQNLIAFSKGEKLPSAVNEIVIARSDPAAAGERRSNPVVKTYNLQL